MQPDRFDQITRQYARLRIAVVGDFCLDRYLEIDPAREEISLETGLPVHNVISVRAQAGAAGTVVNNLAALGVGSIYPIGFCGEDGEGHELRRALAGIEGVKLDYFFATPLRRTFTYCKPLVLAARQPPRELNRLDSKNWSPTPPSVVERVLGSMSALRGQLDAIIALDQVTTPETGVITARVRNALHRQETLVVADARLGLSGYPPVVFKMNLAELRRMEKLAQTPSLEEARAAAATISQRNGRPVVVTMAEGGLVGAEPGGSTAHVPALPVRGPIDVVGAGDAVTANVTAAWAAGATLAEALELAAAASSIVIHQLGTTGTASVGQLREAMTI